MPTEPEVVDPTPRVFLVATMSWWWCQSAQNPIDRHGLIPESLHKIVEPPAEMGIRPHYKIYDKYSISVALKTMKHIET